MSEKNQWLFALANKDKITLFLDNDVTSFIFDEQKAEYDRMEEQELDGADFEYERFTFGDFIGNSYGLIALLDALGFNYEEA